MEVLIQDVGAERVMPSGARQMYPVGWQGAVEDHVGAVWVENNLAVDITPEAGEMGFTPRQTGVLREIADHALATHDSQTVDVDFRDMTVADLRELAATIPIDGSDRMKNVDLIAALEDKQEELREAMEAAALEAAEGEAE